MKFSEKWLREWIDPPISTAELSEQLTMAGLEVEGVESCQPGFTNVIVAKVLQVEKHHQVDKLSVCQVDVGGKESLTVVCGADNVRADGIYPFARIGATLANAKLIKKSEIKGVNSEGMLCSGAELGLTDDSDVIMELDSDAIPGVALEEYLALDDQIIELSLTPNRGDCLSIRGIARDVGVINALQVNQLSITPIEVKTENTKEVTLDAPEACPRYVGRVIEDVNLNRKAPVWLTEKLRRSGLRSINIIVDITNYVMLELGQPMHAFDLDLVKGGITVRYAKDGETLTLLDGEQVELTKGTLIIADDARAIAMAGIMGGLNSGVTDKTENVFLESAFFMPEVIMGKARQYGLHTDSSRRFERGVDYDLQAYAVERATALMLELCGGSAGPVIDINAPTHLPTKQTVLLRSEKINGLLGIKIDNTRIDDILQRLCMETVEISDGWEIKVPSFRFDISMETDLIEEIARIYGYDHIPTAPIRASLKINRIERNRDINELRHILVNRGYHEAMTYSFINTDLQRLIIDEEQAEICLLNPISSELGVMRQSLWPGLLTALQYNLKRQQQRVRLFEFGRVFSRAGDNISQELKIAGLISGNNYEIQWDIDNNSSNFYDIKGDIEALVLSGNDNIQLEYRAINEITLHPGQSAEIIYDNQSVGKFGAIHPKIMNELELIDPVFVFELDLTGISKKIDHKYQNLSKFPSIKRDISILVDKELPVAKLMNTIKSASPVLLNNLELFDVYHGEGIDILKKSLALGLTFQASSNTLVDEEVEGEVEKILTALNLEFDIKLRE